MKIQKGNYSSIRIKAMIMALIMGTTVPLLSSCSSKKEEDGVYSTVETSYNSELCDYRLERLTHIKNDSNENLYGKNLKYDYYLDIDRNNRQSIIDQYKGLSASIPTASFVHLIDESIITNKINVGDGKTAMSLGTFRTFLDLFVLPDSLRKENIPYQCADYEMVTKKFLTLNGETLYGINYKMTFKDTIESHSKKIKSNDVIECNLLYHYLGKGTFVLLYRNQTGLGSNEKNVSNVNFNNDRPLIVKVNSIEEFNDLNGVLSNSYLKEVSDTYSGINRYYDSSNKELDFSMYVKKSN